MSAPVSQRFCANFHFKLLIMYLFGWMETFDWGMQCLNKCWALSLFECTTSFHQKKQLRVFQRSDRSLTTHRLLNPSFIADHCDALSAAPYLNESDFSFCSAMNDTDWWWKLSGPHASEWIQNNSAAWAWGARLQHNICCVLLWCVWLFLWENDCERKLDSKIWRNHAVIIFDMVRYLRPI